MVSLIQSYWELIAGNYYGWTEGKLVLLCHISMAGIKERIFQFKTLLDKGVYYFGPRTVAKCTIRIKMYSESLVCSFSYQYNLLTKISILRSSKRNINIWKNPSYTTSQGPVHFICITMLTSFVLATESHRVEKTNVLQKNEFV